MSVRAIAKGWDPLLRIAASTKTGWCSTTYILERFGSAARGDMAYQAGDAFGRLLLTRFLATYLGDPVYRTLNEALLAQGESTHSLQRAINPGMIGARHGRTLEQISAISGCLTLLANIIMTWNATRIGDICAAAPAAFPEQHIKHIAPNAHEHINTKGVLTIDLARHLDQLLGRTPSPANLRQARRKTLNPRKSAIFAAGNPNYRAISITCLAALFAPRSREPPDGPKCVLCRCSTLSRAC